MAHEGPALRSWWAKIKKNIALFVWSVALSAVALWTVTATSNNVTNVEQNSREIGTLAESNKENATRGRDQICEADAGKIALVHTFAHFFATEEEVAASPELTLLHEQLHIAMEESTPAFCRDTTG